MKMYSWHLQFISPYRTPIVINVDVDDARPADFVDYVGILGTDEPSGTDLKAILAQLESRVDHTQLPIHNEINVTRGSILSCAFRAFRRQRFSCIHRLKVQFLDGQGLSEGAVDDGGPTRELFRLLLAAIRDSQYFEGSEDSKNIALVNRALESMAYRLIGQMICMALVVGGATDSVEVEEVSDLELWQHLKKILEARRLEEAQEALIEASGALSLLGCGRSILTLENRGRIVEEAARAYVEGRTKGALEQLIEGLDCLGLAKAMKTHSDKLKPLFVLSAQKLIVQDLLSLFEVKFSPQGSNARVRETKTVGFWRDWLIDVSDGCRPVTLEDVLIFASGVDSLPPLDFLQKPEIEFLHDTGMGPRRYPEANTCSVILRLPLHTEYDDFVEYMESGIRQAPVFVFL
ncbi:hypothetical protein WMY93_009165 [Mugilogobius chulae]|uniref:HECT domain-containing protein n=1 Tax=Mugilogobius chulae TaxID=88201 RepID=A0AAW0PAS7_9GOBI